MKRILEKKSSGWTNPIEDYYLGKATKNNCWKCKLSSYFTKILLPNSFRYQVLTLTRSVIVILQNPHRK